MPAVKMNFEEVFTQLEDWGNENARQMYARQGAGENQFGVTLGNLRGLAKKVKTNHPLAMQLWATGNTDARILATMLMDPHILSMQEIEEMLLPVTYFKLVDELVNNVIVKTGYVEELCEKWCDSPQEYIGRAGWNLMVTRVLGDDKTLVDLDAILNKIETEMKSALKRKQESMNRCLVEIGIHFPEFTKRCITIGEKLGRLDNTPVPKGCVSSYAPEWIAAVVNRKDFSGY